MKTLTMTLICKTCGSQYGAWRHQCPTCGTMTPVSRKQDDARIKQARAPRRKKETKDPCILCRKRVKPKKLATCPHCNEKVHKACLPLHVDECAKFQVLRDQAMKEVSHGAR
jgi:hypothetical protein